MRSIVNALEDIERAHEVRILYACESGSRAWGFASDDSDYDPRFIYVHPRDWYLSISEHRDVIEEQLPGDLDVSGWELRKALRLYRKCNPAMTEWLISPIVYREDPRFASELRELMPTYYVPVRAFKHYLSMARSNYRTYLQGEEIWLKKYLYVLRPILACRWIEQEATPAPVPFDELLTSTLGDGQLLEDIRELVRMKQNAAEMGLTPRHPRISGFIDDELARLEGLQFLEMALPPVRPLDELFRSFVG